MKSRIEAICKLIACQKFCTIVLFSQTVGNNQLLVVNTCKCDLLAALVRNLVGRNDAIIMPYPYLMYMYKIDM